MLIVCDVDFGDLLFDNIQMNAYDPWWLIYFIWLTSGKKRKSLKENEKNFFLIPFKEKNHWKFFFPSSNVHDFVTKKWISTITYRNQIPQRRVNKLSIITSPHKPLIRSSNTELLISPSLDQLLFQTIKILFFFKFDQS